MTMADKLRALREKHGLSVRQAAKACGLAYATWYNWEAGREVPSRANRYAIAAGIIHQVEPFE